MLYQITNPYNITSEKDLEKSLQKYVIKKNELT